MLDHRSSVLISAILKRHDGRLCCDSEAREKQEGSLYSSKFLRGFIDPARWNLEQPLWRVAALQTVGPSSALFRD